MPLSLIVLHYESTAPVSRPQLPREAGASSGFACSRITASTGGMRRYMLSHITVAL
jgi:hypothetical protein